MNYSKQEFMNFIEELNVSYISFDCVLHSPSLRYKTVDMRTGPCKPVPFISMNFDDPDFIEGSLSIKLINKGGE